MAPTKRPARRPVSRPAEEEAEVEETTTKPKFKRPPPREEVDADDEYESDDGDEDEEDGAGGPGPVIREGWGGSQQNFDRNSKYANSLRLDSEPQVIKFLESRPYAGFDRHWVERTIVDDNGKARKVNRPYTCRTSVGMGECPLCDVGDKPQSISAFNVALVGDDGEVSLRSWECGVRLFKIIKNYNDSNKTGPITKGYYLVSRSGSGGTTNYQVNPVPARSLEDDYGVPVPDQRKLDALELYEAKKVVQVPKLRELEEMAAEMADYDEYDEYGD